MLSIKYLPLSIAEEIDRMEHQYLVGRDRELECFLACLADEASTWRILNVYGTGGVGKSYLLDEFRRLAEKAQVPYLYMDSRSFPRTPAGFCSLLIRLLGKPLAPERALQLDDAAWTELCSDLIRRVTARGKLVLALDTFEEFGELEQWLREQFLARLSSNVLMIVSGRLPLQGGWQSSPAWRNLMLRLPLADLSYEAVKQYLSLSGIDQDKTVRQTWIRTKGHPLTLSLFVSADLARKRTSDPLRNEQEVFPHVVRSWLLEVPDPDIRELVEAAAVLRHFHQESLSYITERQVPTEQFEQLVGHSFIRRVDRGWVLHDLLRDAIGYELRQRAPEYYDRLWKRCVYYYYMLIKESAPKKSVSWESGEWVYFIGDRSIRTLFYQQSVPYRLESLHPSNRKDAERYIDFRRLRARDTRIPSADREADEGAEYRITADEGLLWLKRFDLQERYEVDPGSVKLLRDEGGRVFGLAAIVPIHEGTLDWLLKANPASSAYFSSLPETRLKELRTPRSSAAGYFIESIDVDDYADYSKRQAAGLTFISYMLSAGLTVTTAPSIPFFHSIFRSLGFEKVKDVGHYAYDDHCPTPYYALDTRGAKLLSYLNRMIASFGMMPDKKSGEERLRLLSKREREVTDLLSAGRTNSEIADGLCLSEATVKRHVFNIFRKLQVKNRIQLVNELKDR